MPPLKVSTRSRAEVSAGSVRVSPPLTESLVMRPPGARAARTRLSPETLLSPRRSTRPADRSASPDTVPMSTEPDTRPFTRTSPLTESTARLAVSRSRSRSPLTVSILASPGRAARTTTLPLTVSTASLRPPTPVIATLALTLSTFTPARAGTDTSITLGPLRPPSPPQPNQPPPPDG